MEVNHPAGRFVYLHMRRSVIVPILATALVLFTVVPSHAWWHRGWWGPPYPYWYYRPHYYVYAPPAVIVEPPPVYIQQEPPPPQAYWYYCSSAQAYYPNVQTCPEAWVKVPPRSP
jgi:hypothetical protein